MTRIVLLLINLYICNGLTVNGDGGPSYKQMWNGKVPTRLKYFCGWWWLRNAVLIKDDIIFSKVSGRATPRATFVIRTKISLTLFFSCPVAKGVWSIVALLHTTLALLIETTMQFDSGLGMCQWTASNSNKVHVFGTTAVCREIWKTRNKSCFERKWWSSLLKSPASPRSHTHGRPAHILNTLRS